MHAERLPPALMILQPRRDSGIRNDFGAKVTSDRLEPHLIPTRGQNPDSGVMEPVLGFSMEKHSMGSTKMNPVPPHSLPSQVVKDDEPLLVAAAKSGDISAFETLVSRYERKIFRLTQNITQNREDAEDAMQEAFLKAYEHLGEFQGNSRFYTWLVRIAVNEALMKLRQRRPNEVSLDEEMDTGEDMVTREVEDWGPSPEERYEQTELLADSIHSDGRT